MPDKATENYIYEPTAGEKKLIEVLINPEHYAKSVKTKCSLADVDRTVYYDAMKKPEFVKYYNNLVVEMMRGKVSDIINATYKFATSMPQNHQDRKMLLEMTGIYTPKQEVESKNTNINLDKDVDNMTLEEIEEELRKLEK